MKQSWKKYLLYGSAIVVVAVLAYILIETIRLKNTGFEGKTLWQWMELLIIPLFLAGGAIYLERSERAVERRIAAERADHERKAAEERAKLEREIATDSQQEAALQAYLDRMAELLLKEDLRKSENEEVRNIARIRTLTVLRGLDTKRKGLVLSFLHEAGLINKEKTVVSLDGADLNGANLSNTYLPEANLKGALLEDANLSRTVLKSANLSEALLRGASLSYANLTDVHLLNTILDGADLTGAILNDSEVLFVALADVIGGDSILDYGKSAFLGPNGISILGSKSLSDAGREQLANARSVKGAIMPDGTKHD